MQNLSPFHQPNIFLVQGEHGHGVAFSSHKLHFEGFPTLIEVHDRSNVAAFKPTLFKVSKEDYCIKFSNHHFASACYAGYPVISRGRSFADLDYPNDSHVHDAVLWSHYGTIDDVLCAVRRIFRRLNLFSACDVEQTVLEQISPDQVGPNRPSSVCMRLLCGVRRLAGYSSSKSMLPNCWAEWITVSTATSSSSGSTMWMIL